MLAEAGAEAAKIPAWQYVGGVVVIWLVSMIEAWRRGGKKERSDRARGLVLPDDEAVARITKLAWREIVNKVGQHETAIVRINTHDLPVLIDELAQQNVELAGWVAMYKTDKESLLRLEERFKASIELQSQRDERMEKDRFETLERLRTIDAKLERAVGRSEFGSSGMSMRNKD